MRGNLRNLLEVVRGEVKVMRVSDEQLNNLLMRIMQKTSDEGVKGFVKSY